MTTIEQPAKSASGVGVGALQSRSDALSEILQATASSLAAARAVMDTATQTAFAFLAEANAVDRSALMGELSETALMHDAMLAGYAKALGTSAAGGNELAKQLGYRSVADMLQHELGRRKGDTDTIVRLAEILRDGTYPTLAIAIEDGKVSLHQAGVIASVLDDEARHYHPEDIERVEAAATDFAIGTDTQLPLKPEQLQKLVRAWFKQLQPEKTELDAKEQHVLREASYCTTKTGMIRVRALLPAKEGAAVLQFLDANAAPRVRFTAPDQHESACCCSDPENRCGATYVIDGSDSDGSARPVTSHCDQCQPEDPRTRKQKMADVFSTAFTIAAKTKDTATQGGACPTLVVTMPVDQLDRHARSMPATAMLQRTEEVVPAHVAARILCDGQIQAAITGDDGTVLHLGRSRRLFSPEQRTALALTYPTCAVVDCDIPSVWCEAHHVEWWSNGGKTDIDNGMLLCNYHHHQVHADNLDIIPDRSAEHRGGTTPGGRWRVRRKARIRAGVARPERRNPGQRGTQHIEQSSEPPLGQLSAAHPSAGTGHPGRRGERVRSETEPADDDPSESS